eukprot:16285056-Heterocapsa_arctica.AAC.1
MDRSRTRTGPGPMGPVPYIDRSRAGTAPSSAVGSVPHRDLSGPAPGPDPRWDSSRNGTRP